MLGHRTVLETDKALVRARARHLSSDLEVVGYEIHHGQTRHDGLCVEVRREDGADIGLRSPDGMVWGTYLHGLFDADRFRRWFVDRVRERKGMAPLGRVVARYDIDPALDRLQHMKPLEMCMTTLKRWLTIWLNHSWVVRGLASRLLASMPRITRQRLVAFMSTSKRTGQ